MFAGQTMYGPGSMGTLGAAAPTIPPCLQNAPFGFGINQNYFDAGGRYASGSAGESQVREWGQGIDEHLRKACFGDDVGSSSYALMYSFTLTMLVNERYECAQLEQDMDAELAALEQENADLLTGIQQYQEALESGLGCPSPPPPPTVTACPPCSPVTAARRQQQQQGGTKWGANLGWLAGGAVLGAGGYFLVRGR